MERAPERVVKLAVQGMLPKSRLGRSMIKKLRVYAGPDPPALRAAAAAAPAAVASRVVDRSRGTPPLSKPLIQTTGRRKEAVARVRLRPGTGKLVVNGKEIEQYFRIATHRMAATESLRITQTADVYDVDATIHGGGISGQAGALGLGIARALVDARPRGASGAEEVRAAHAGRS